MSKVLYVFAYDVSRDRIRRRVAARLEEECVRVQRSVLEARMPADQARHLAMQATFEPEPGDSLRVYAVTDRGLDRSFAYGPLPLPERQDFYLL
jgi:CRISPR-associated protein Cas2